MKPLGVMTGIAYDRPVLEVLDVLEEHGVTHTELWGHPEHGDLTDENLRYILQKYQWNRRIDIVAYHPPGAEDWNLAATGKAREEAVDRLRKKLDYLAPLGIHRMIVHPGGERPGDRTPADDALKRSAESLHTLLEAADERGVEICLENTLPHHLGGNLEEMRYLDRELDGAFQVTLDTSHAHLSSGVMPFIEEFGPRINHTHLSDNQGTHDDHYPPGEGTIDFPRILERLAEVAPLDYWMMEVLRLPEEGDRPLGAKVARSLEGLRRCLREVATRSS